MNYPIDQVDPFDRQRTTLMDQPTAYTTTELVFTAAVGDPGWRAGDDASARGFARQSVPAEVSS